MKNFGSILENLSKLSLLSLSHKESDSLEAALEKISAIAHKLPKAAKAGHALQGKLVLPRGLASMDNIIFWKNVPRVEGRFINVGKVFNDR